MNNTLGFVDNEDGGAAGGNDIICEVFDVVDRESVGIGSKGDSIVKANGLAASQQGRSRRVAESVVDGIVRDGFRDNFIERFIEECINGIQVSQRGAGENGRGDISDTRAVSGTGVQLR